MKKLIKEYKKNENDQIIDVILKYVDQDLRDYKYEDENEIDNDVEPEIFIAYRIRAFILNEVFRERKYENTYLNDKQEKEDYEALNAWIDSMRYEPWLDVNVYEIKEFDFTSVHNNILKIRRQYGHQYRDLVNLVKKFENNNQNSDKFKEDFEKVKAKYIDLFIDALRHAINNVDADRDNKEIVKYINIVMMGKFVDLRMKKEDFKRVQRQGKDIYVKIDWNKFDDNTSWMSIFNKSLMIVNVDDFNLTENQKRFTKKLHEIVQMEITKENENAFWFDEFGHLKIKNKYFAEQLAMNENSFKSALKRIKDKIDLEWPEVWKKAVKPVMKLQPLRGYILYK